MIRAQSNSCWVEIDLNAIEENVRLIGQQSGVQVMAVVKANAYGHGSVPVTRAALRGGASWLGVARPEEALELRRAGIAAPILLLGFTPTQWVKHAVENDISLAFWNIRQLGEASKAAEHLRKLAKLHLKVDTGMNRLGVQPETACDLARETSQHQNVILEAVFTHFARADEVDTSSTDDQESRFREVLDELEAIGLRPRLVHAANSAASLTRPSTYFNMVRAGIAIYGLHPSPECTLSEGFKPALTWKTVISHVKRIPPGRGISYGHEYITKESELIGTLPVGYADGYRRIFGNTVLVGGRKVPVVGRVCMDQVMVNLNEVPEAQPGDEVVLIGKQGDARLTAEDVAEIWKTINYEVVCAIALRVPRFYVR